MKHLTREAQNHNHHSSLQWLWSTDDWLCRDNFVRVRSRLIKPISASNLFEGKEDELLYLLENIKDLSDNGVYLSLPWSHKASLETIRVSCDVLHSGLHRPHFASVKNSAADLHLNIRIRREIAHAKALSEKILVFINPAYLNYACHRLPRPITSSEARSLRSFQHRTLRHMTLPQSYTTQCWSYRLVKRMFAFLDKPPACTASAGYKVQTWWQRFCHRLCRRHAKSDAITQKLEWRCTL